MRYKRRTKYNADLLQESSNDPSTYPSASKIQGAEFGSNGRWGNNINYNLMIVGIRWWSSPKWFVMCLPWDQGDCRYAANICTSCGISCVSRSFWVWIESEQIHHFQCTPSKPNMGTALSNKWGEKVISETKRQHKDKFETQRQRQHYHKLIGQQPSCLHQRSRALPRSPWSFHASKITGK